MLSTPAILDCPPHPSSTQQWVEWKSDEYFSFQCHSSSSFSPQSPDGRLVASGAVDGIINLFDVESGTLLHTLEGHAMPVRSLCFSPDSQLLVTASDDKDMKIYDV